MKRIVTILIIILLLILSGTNFVKAPNHHHSIVPLDSKDWTIMIYLDGDCDLESFQIEAFLLMASVGSTADINILVQFDRIDGYDGRYGDWTGCKRFYITSGITPEGFNALSHIGEVNMGDPLTLENFIIWSVNAYPSNNYALILSDHGDNGGVCEDLTGNYDYLSCSELHEVLQTVNQSIGVTIDLIVFEACLMGAVEVAYHSTIGARVMVASEELGADYFPYDNILSELVASPTMNLTSLAQKFVHYYMLLWNDRPPPYDVVSLSAFNLTLIASDLIPAVNALANNLNQTLTEHAYDILAAIDDTEYTYPPAAEPYYVGDLYHFAQNIKEHIQDLQVQTAAQNILDSIDEAQIAEWHGPAHSNYHGLSIYLPPTEDAYHSRTMLYTLDNIRWATNTLWCDFLHALFITHAPGIRSQESLNDIYFTPFDSNTDGYFDAIHVTLDADTTAQTINITVQSRLIDPSNNTVDTDSANWTISNNEDEWHSLTLHMPAGNEEGYYDVELLLYDEYGIYEDYHRSSDVTYLPEEMKHDVAVNNAFIIKTVVGQGFPAEIEATIEDKGHYPETFNVTTYANGIVVNIIEVTLMSGDSVTLAISWNTESQPKGNCTISISAELVDGEVNVTNNNLGIDVKLFITIPGDVDEDKDVDIFDVILIAGSYGFFQGDPWYVPNNDINSDGKTDIFDIVIAAGHYGESW